MAVAGRRFAAALLPRLFGKNPRSHHKGAAGTGRVRTGDQRLCHCQLGQDVPKHCDLLSIIVATWPSASGACGLARRPRRSRRRSVALPWPPPLTEAGCSRAGGSRPGAVAAAAPAAAAVKGVQRFGFTVTVLRDRAGEAPALPATVRHQVSKVHRASDRQAQAAAWL